MNERHPDHAREVFGGLLEPREDSSAFLEPANQTFDDMAIAIGFTIKLDATRSAVFVGFGRYHRLDAKCQQVGIDPIRAVSFVAGQRHRPSDRFTLTIHHVGIGTGQQRIHHRRLVRLTGGQMKVEWMTPAVTENVDFAGYTATGATKGMVLRFLRVPFFPPPDAHRAARTIVPSIHHN